ncbi:hypothetical protein GT002_41185, partial [Streptomyces sp. SID4917]|nr:hypothetical protein [Streptomyces sp. SID4917]
AAAAAGFAATATPAAAAQTSVLPGHGTSGSAAPWRPVIRVVERPLPVRDFMNA